MRSTTERGARALALFDELVDLDAPTRASRLDEVRALDAVLADQVAGMLLADANTGCLMDQGMSDLAASISAGAKAASAGSEGRQIGPFVLRRLVGLGGMGEVWLAQRVDGDFNQEVALKLCRYGMGSEDILRRFVQERRILADLSHPGIARFIDGGVGDTGAPWFAMEYVEGVALTDYSRNHRLGVRERVALMADVAEVVAYAQAHLVVHRDLKPSNIWVDDDGRVKLLDFGIAKLLQDEPDVRGTSTGLRAMSPAYAAPEQVFDEPISTATDVYALGVVLYELLTATLPHQRSSATLETLVDTVRHEIPLKPSARLRESDESIVRALGASVGTLSRFARNVSGELDTIVLTALRREPARRYASAAAMADDLRRWLDGRPVAAQADSASYRMRKFVSRHRLAVGSASGVLLALIAGFGTALWQASVAREAAQRADAAAESSERIATFALTMVGEQYAHGRRTAEPRSPQETLVSSIESARETLKDDDRARAEILGKLGELQAVIDSPKRAEPAVVEALQLTRKIYGNADRETANALVSVATVKDQSDQLDEAESLLREALPIYAATPGNERSIVITRSRLASILRRTGRIDEAIQELDSARAASGAAYGINHPNTIELTNNGAMLLEQIDRLAEAQTGFRSAIAAFEKIDPAFPRLASPLFNLGLLLSRTGRYDEARASMQHALDIGRRHIGMADPFVVNMAARHAELLRRIGETDAARRELEAIDTTTLRDRPVNYSRFLRLRAELLNDSGRPEEALAKFDEAAQALQGSAGDLTDALASLDLARADAMMSSDRWSQAAAIVSRVRQNLDAESKVPTDLRVELVRIEARIAKHAGRLDDASAMLASAVKMLIPITGAETIEVARLELDQAALLDATPALSKEASSTRRSARERLNRLGVSPVWARDIN